MIKKFLPNNSCFNITSETYNGKEQSPKGLGYSAVAYNIGYEMTGKDGLIWCVQMKNNKKVWFRKNGMPIVTHEEPLIIDVPESPKENIETSIQETTKEIKKTRRDLNELNTNPLKEENSKNGIKKENKIIKDETIAVWNILKKNKKELELYMNSIKNKT